MTTTRFGERATSVTRSRLRIGLWCSALGVLWACEPTQPKLLAPFGEIVVAVDTDAPVPGFVGGLRLDLFDEKGTWLESRDVARTNATDWPASFSVYTLDEKVPRTVLLRARAYLEGRTRQYRGERFQSHAPYVEPRVADTLEMLCADMPALPLGQEVTLRRGSRTVTGYLPDQRPAGAPNNWTPACAYQVAGGAVAARLDIAQAGTYRIETTRTNPPFTFFADVNLFIRRDCRDQLSQIACADDIVSGKQNRPPSDYLSRLVVDLDPGSYAVIASGYYYTPADITLRAEIAEKWGQPQAPPPPVSRPSLGLPRLLVNGRDVTPADEPQPLVTIDRLARLEIVPGKKQLASIVLRTACAGLMPKLSRAATNADPVLDEAETCVDTEGKRVPLTVEPLVPWPGAALHSNGPLPLEHGCTNTAQREDVACVPAGTFVIGSPDGVIPLSVSSAPERFAVMSSFWMDKTEVTVGRWRAAVLKGFKSPNATPIENNALYATTPTEPFTRQCTYVGSTGFTGQSRVDFPLNCVDWHAARAFCAFEGGDLPTEAQWEYAATKAGRAFETRFPWGDLDGKPSCDQAVFARQNDPNSAVAGRACESKGYGVREVSDQVALRDATPLGLLGLGGNLSEWTLDAFEPYESPCWKAATLTDPVCWQKNAPLRTARGSSWSSDAVALAGWFRAFLPPLGFETVPNLIGHAASTNTFGYVSVGFRCVYKKVPK